MSRVLYLLFISKKDERIEWYRQIECGTTQFA